MNAAIMPWLLCLLVTTGAVWIILHGEADAPHFVSIRKFVLGVELLFESLFFGAVGFAICAIVFIATGA